jgi:hypothetical protein
MKRNEEVPVSSAEWVVNMSFFSGDYDALNQNLSQLKKCKTTKKS